MKKRAARRITHLTFAEAIAFLIENPQSTYAEITEATGFHDRTTRNLIAALRGKKLVFISGWEYNAANIPNIPQFSWGTGKDKPQPNKGGAARSAEYRERKKKAWLQQILAGADRFALAA